MFKKLRLKRKLLILSIPVLLIGSAVALYTNGFFYYSEFKTSIEIKYNLEDQGKLKDLMDQAFKLNNVASIDRENNVIEFENTNLDAVKSNIAQETKDFSGLSYSIKEKSSLTKGALSSVIIGVYLLFIGGIAVHFYFIAVKGGKLRIILGTYVIFLVNLTFSTVISLGLLSLISRLYKVTSLDLLFLMVSSIFAFILFYLASNNIYELTSFQSVGATFKSFLVKNYKQILLTSISLILIASIGLGTTFVIHALILVAFFIITYYQFYWHSYLTEDVHNLKQSLDYRLSAFSRKNKYAKKASAPIVLTPKKDKKKKKKKK